MQNDWSPETYGRFRGLRLRPALDLIARVGPLPPGDIIDLGCGDGALAGPLTQAWPGRALWGVDTSRTMLDKAALAGGYAQLLRISIADWQALHPPALIFSNAALHWVSDHARLLPRLATMLTAGGVLAVQMPRQNDAPSHRLARSIAAEIAGARHDPGADPVHCAPASDYARLLAPLGAVEAWETEYIQRLAPTQTGHPVRAFTESTVLRPLLAVLDPAEQTLFLRRYDEALGLAYPPEADGSVLFPFRRCFFILKV